MYQQISLSINEQTYHSVICENVCLFGCSQGCCANVMSLVNSREVSACKCAYYQ